MPLYEYVCTKCSTHFEDLVSAGARVTCPKCASPKVTRELSVVSVGRAKGGSASEASPCGSCGDRRANGSCGRG